MTTTHDRHANAGANVVALACSQDGERAFSLGRDGQIRVTDTVTGDELKCRKHASVLYAGGADVTPDGGVVAVGGTNVWLLDGARYKRLVAIKRPGREPVADLAFSPCGTMLATTGAASSAFKQPPVRVWRVDTGALVAEHTLEAFGSSATGRALCWLDSDTVVIHADGALVRLDVAAGSLHRIHPAASNFRGLEARSGHIVMQDKQGLRLLTREGEVHREIALESPLPGRPSSWCLAVSPSGRTVASGITVRAQDRVPNHSFVVLYDMEAGRELRRFELMAFEVERLAWVGESALLTGDNDGELHRWSVEDGDVVW